MLTDFFRNHQIKPPILERFTPNEEALFKPLYVDVGATQTGRPFVPCDPDSRISSENRPPSLLLYDLQNAKYKETAVYKRIDARTRDGVMILYGTSGAGKTRSIFEYLSQNKGFYFIAGNPRDDKNPGSEDLKSIFFEDFGKIARANTDEGLEESVENLRVIRLRLQLLIYVRVMVHHFITGQLGRDITAYEWLLYQLYPNQFLGGDVYRDLVNDCIDDCVDMERTTMLLRKEAKKPSWQFRVPFIDESQQLLDERKGYFLSTDGTEHRSAFSAVLKAFVEFPSKIKGLSYPVFSGTGMSLTELRKQSNSATTKGRFVPPEYSEPCFSRFAPLDVDAVITYLRIFLKLDKDDDGGGGCGGGGVREEVVKHVAQWLRGRPRFTASFVETYLFKNRKQPRIESRGNFNETEGRVMEGLDRYIAAMTTDRADPRTSWVTGGSSAYDCFEKVARMPDKDDTIADLKEDLHSSVLEFAIGGKHVYFWGEASKELIQKGVAAVSIKRPRGGTGIIGSLDEPIMIEAGLNFYNMKKSLARRVLRSPSGGKGEAFEELLLSPLHDNEKWQDFLEHELDGDGHDFKDYSVFSRSSYGALAKSCKESIADTIQWIKDAASSKFDGQVPPFCFPDDNFGPDVLFLMWNKDHTEFRPVLTQSKFAGTVLQDPALLTTDPTLLYLENRGKEKQKPSTKLKTKSSSELWDNWWDLARPKLLNEERPCLRLMVQYPANAGCGAESGQRYKRGYTEDTLVVVSGENALSLFEEKTLNAMKSVKGSPQRKRSKKSEQDSG